MKPEKPSDAGVPEHHADVDHEEGAHLLAAEARRRLESDGFTWDMILEWAEAYLNDQGSGDVDSFLGWIEEKERI